MPPKRLRPAVSAATKQQIRDAHGNNVASQAQKTTEGRFLTIAGNKKITLLYPDGTITAAGRYYYTDLLGLEPPSLYAYEAHIEDEKWVRGFSGKRILVRKWINGEWVPTAKGLPYFKFLRDEHTIQVATLKVTQNRDGAQRVIPHNRAVVENLPFTLSDQRFTTPYLKSPAAGIAYRGLTTEAQRTDFVRAAALSYLRSLETIEVNGVTYHVLQHDSVPILWDESQPIVESRRRTNVVGEGPPTTEVILNRPLLSHPLPEGCWRPYDLHPNALADLKVCCVVQMVHDSYQVCKQASGAAKRNGAQKKLWSFGATLDQIEKDFDKIYDDLGYVDGDFPFENNWRTDGATSKMVLRYAELHNLKCYVHHKGAKVEVFIPEKVDCHTPTINYSLFGHHAYWYAPVIHKDGTREEASEANMAMSKTVIRSEQTEEEKEELYDAFADKAIAEIVAKVHTPAYTEWGDMESLVLTTVSEEGEELPFEAFRYQAPEGKPTLSSSRARQAHNKKKIYFCNCPNNSQTWSSFTSCLAKLYKLGEEMKSSKQAFTITLCYGASPDIPISARILARNCPTIICRSVPRDVHYLNTICEHATKTLGYDGSAMVYMGQSGGAVCERLRILFSRANRKTWTPAERASILATSRQKCSVCAEDLEEGAYHIDHIRALSDGGKDELANCQALCLICHADKSETERLTSLVSKPLVSDLSTDVLEALVDAPKPMQLVFGDGHNPQKCFSIDAIRCRNSALIHNQHPIPVASVLDTIKAWDREVNPHPDFYYIDAGAPEAFPLASAPYFGPAWYWIESYRYIVEVCWSLKGKITPEDVVCVFSASDHAPANSLKVVYSKIEATIEAALLGHKKQWDVAKAKNQKKMSDANQEGTLVTEKDIYKQMKLMMLSMQGGWLVRTASTWTAVRSSSAADAEGPIHLTRALPDGTTRWMSCKRHLGNHTMFLVGLISLHTEQLIVAQMRRGIQRALGFQPRGGCVDCLFYKLEEKEKIVPIIDRLTYTDGSPIWKMEEAINVPHCILGTKEIIPANSVWRSFGDEEQELSLRFDNESFGNWSSERRFAYKRDWRVLTEPEGLGRGEEDEYQEEAAIALADNNGGVCIGQGGSGKSHILKRLRTILEERGVKVIVCAFTHVAAQNCEGQTILHSLNSSVRCKKTAILIDEMSMVPLKLWAALAQMQMTGNLFYIFGDCAGQFLPIQDQHRISQLEGLDRSDFIHSLTNGLRVEVKKYRRGGDMAHYNFVGGIYDKDLGTALQEARERYPIRNPFNGTTLCISHSSRVRYNAEVNARIAPPEHLCIEASTKPSGGANQSQDMRVWVGIVLVALGTHDVLKNGLRYKILTLPAGEVTTFSLQGVNDDDVLLGEPFEVTRDTLASELRLTHAICYFSCQARTIKGPLRLSDTRHHHFSIRHLIVGCGRAPEGLSVQVE